MFDSQPPITAENGQRRALPKGYILDGYTIESVLGRGGFGITYLAREPRLERLVAIKEYLPTEFSIRDNNYTVHPRTGDVDNVYAWGLTRFLEEAQTLAKFLHPNIVHVNNLLEENNTAYMVMKYEEGDSLAKIFEQGKMRDQEALLNILLPIVDGLSKVHAQGFIHRDIKPSNIYIREDLSPVLLDFGSARQLVKGQTQAMTRLISQSYTPFEQYSNIEGKQGPWTDIYSLGATLYFGISGSLPVDATMRSASIIDQNYDCLELLAANSRLLNSYGREFLEAIDWALSFKTIDRPQSVEEWVASFVNDQSGRSEALSEILEDDYTRAMPPDVVARVSRTSRQQHSARIDDEHASLGTSLLESGEQRGYSNSGLRLQNETPEHSPYTVLHSEKRSPKKRKKGKLLIVGAAFSLLICAVVLGGLYYKNTLAPKFELERKTNALLARAKDNMLERRYISPSNSNAYDLYTAALVLDPDSETAKREITRIQKIVTASITDLISSLQIKSAKEQISLLSTIGFPTAVVDSLRGSLRDAELVLDKSNELNSELVLTAQLISSGKVLDLNGEGAIRALTELSDQYPDNSEVQSQRAEAMQIAFRQVDEKIASRDRVEAGSLMTWIELYGGNEDELLDRRNRLESLNAPKQAVAVTKTTPAKIEKPSVSNKKQASAAIPTRRKRLSAKEREEAQRQSLSSLFTDLDNNSSKPSKNSNSRKSNKQTNDSEAMPNAGSTMSLNELVAVFFSVKESVEVLDIRTLRRSTEMSGDTFQEITELGSQYSATTVELSEVDIFDDRGMATAELRVVSAKALNGRSRSLDQSYSLLMTRKSGRWQKIRW